MAEISQALSSFKIHHQLLANIVRAELFADNFLSPRYANMNATYAIISANVKSWWWIRVFPNQCLTDFEKYAIPQMIGTEILYCLIMILTWIKPWPFHP